MTVEMRLVNEEKRYFNGLVKRFSQGGRDEAFVRFTRGNGPQDFGC